MDLDEDEAELIEAEVGDLLEGALVASAARWVDHPRNVDLAENKLFQLAIAHAQGVSIPRSVVTNRPSRAMALSQEAPIVAKAVSSGEGLAPFVRGVPSEALPRVKHAPVLLQRQIMAISDLRVVTIGDRGFVWSRPRVEGAVDWREVDPPGDGFAPVEDESLVRLAATICRCLGITHSSQDWLATKFGPVFLEANPGGQWLFLSGARDSVVPAMGDHLCSGR
jgi:glutathione synthase/RimK-type ligase-like ATP-grasp enzyme